MSIIETSAPEADPTPVDQTPAPEPDLFDDPAAQTFPREYVEKLRREAAEYRTSYAPYRDTFGSADDDVREYLLDLNRMILDPNKRDAAVEELEALLSTMSPGERKRAEATLEGDTVDPDKPLTLKEWEKIQAKKDADAKAAGEVEAIYSQAAGLSTDWANYDKAGDEFGDLASLLFIATNKTKGDLQKAHELRAERFNAAVEAAVNAKLEAIRTGSEKWAPVRPAGTTVAEEPDTPKTFAEAKRRAMQREERLRGNIVD